ncbi:MAG: CCA tRNA nucleotidyltransferase [Thermoproteota archaeon]
MRDISKILDYVRGLVVPTEKEKERMLAKVESLRERLERSFSSLPYPVEVLVQGSIAKDTWLKGETDVDIFVRFGPEHSKEEIASETISIVKRIFGERRCVERYAEHPFVTVRLKGMDVDVVPCYNVRKGEWISATDRTPYHTDFVRSELPYKEKDEARVIKRFAKSIEVYGAEIKVGGFSGLLCELLAHHFGSFLKMVEAMASLKLPLIIDPMEYYRGREDEVHDIFNSDFVVVDPIDEKRNVAAAVTRTKLNEMVLASIAFLKDPGIRFFFPKIKEPNLNQLRKKIRMDRRQLLAIQLGKIEAPPDILWGQLYSARDKILTIMHNGDFDVMRIAAWTDEISYSLIVMELSSRVLPRLKLKTGPPVTSPHTPRYLDLYAGGGAAVGPWIQGERLFILARRRNTDAAAYLKKTIREYAKAGAIPSLIAKRISKGTRILIDEEILASIKGKEARNFISSFIDGRPAWMRSS